MSDPPLVSFLAASLPILVSPLTLPELTCLK